MDWADEKAEALRYTLARQPDTRHGMLTASALREAYERGLHDERWTCWSDVVLAIEDCKNQEDRGAAVYPAMGLRKVLNGLVARDRASRQKAEVK